MTAEADSDVLPVGTIIGDSPGAELPPVAKESSVYDYEPVKSSPPSKFMRNNVDSVNLCYNLLYSTLLISAIALGIAFPGTLTFGVPLIALISVSLPYCVTSFQTHPTLNNATKEMGLEELQQTLKNLQREEPTLNMIIKGFRTGHLNHGATINILAFVKAKEADFEDWFDSSPDQTIFANNSKITLQNSAFDIENIPKPSSRLERIQITCEYDFVDQETKQDLSMQKAAFIASNIGPDDDYEFNIKYSVGKHPKFVIIKQDKPSICKEFFFSFRLYLACVILGFGYPFRKFIEACFLKTSVWKSKKTLSKNGLDREIEDIELQQAVLIDP